MSKKPETVFKERVYPELKSLPYTWVKKINQVALRGLPDFIMCMSGIFAVIELKKSENDQPDSLQEFNLARIAECGGISIVLYPENKDKVINYLRKFAAAAARDKTNKERIQ